MSFIEELRWRGMIHDMMPGTEEQFAKEMTAAYIGFDPTGDSLHIGSLVQIMILVHLQKAGHKPYALVGGATGMVGDPSGKSAERNLLDAETLNHNLACIQKQLEKFLDFNCGENSAQVVNNYDWFREFSFLDFIRNVGKHISVNYMMAKDSVKTRLETGMSFTEFSYQLVQGYDFYWLWKNKNCKVQLGGSDQWGNIVTGTELIRRKAGGEAFACTTPLIKKADGSKFGKTEDGNVWLDKEKTSVRDFYQYWLNASDEDAGNYIRIFTLKTQAEIEALEAEHKKDAEQKLLQKELAKDITIRVHSQADYDSLGLDNNIMFDRSIGQDELKNMPAEELIAAMQSYDNINASLNQEVPIIEFLTGATGNAIYQSNGEARRALDQNAVSINKEKVGTDYVISANDLLPGNVIIVSKGKKKHFLITAAS
ncbi:MAG: tyrosine--tRNA ligase [Flavobacteriales bacterium]|nr:tyrosine--tRNA ligase [Flavobacteriales bacterium]